MFKEEIDWKEKQKEGAALKRKKSRTSSSSGRR
jgi:hypothetical protein